MAKPKKEALSPAQKFEKKVADACGQEVVDSILGEGEKELKGRLVRLSMHEKETDDARANDEAVLDLKAELLQAEGPYKDTLKGIKLQRKLCVTRLEQQGKA